MDERIKASIALKKPDGTILFFSEGIEDAFQVKAEHMVGKTDFHLMPDAEAQAIRSQDRYVITSGMPMQTIEKTTLPNGELCYWFVDRFIINSPVGPLLAIKALVITELVKTAGHNEAANIARQKLQAMAHLDAELKAKAMELTEP